MVRHKIVRVKPTRIKATTYMLKKKRICRTVPGKKKKVCYIRRPQSVHKKAYKRKAYTRKVGKYIRL